MHNDKKNTYSGIKSSAPTDQELASRLRDALRERGHTMKDASEALSVPYRSVQNYLSGDSKIPAVFFLRLCEFMDIEADYFLRRDFRPRYDELSDAVLLALRDCGSIEGYVFGVNPQRDERGKAVGDSEAILSLQHRLTSNIRERYNAYRKEKSLRESAAGDTVDAEFRKR